MGDGNKTREPGWCHVLPMVAVGGTKEGSTRPHNNMAIIDYDGEGGICWHIKRYLEFWPATEALF